MKRYKYPIVVVAAADSCRLESTDAGTMKIDWEVKLLVVASIFLGIKFLGISHDNWMHLAVLRTVCLVFNAASLLVSLKLVREIELSTGNRDAKDAERGRLQKIFRGGLVRIIIVAALHFGLKMMPPLMVSSAMATFDILENPSIDRLKKDKET